MCFAWCKGQANDRADMISRLDGSLTCDSEEMDSLVRSAWLPIFRMYASSPPPSWHVFKERFGKYFSKNHEMQFASVHGEQLRATLLRMKSKTAVGCDGWRVDELKRLPTPLLDRLACLFDVIEETGCWPSALTVGIISLPGCSEVHQKVVSAFFR